MLWEAYKAVKSNKGAAGVDGQNIEEFDKNIGKNLYKIWNRMSSGTYFPKAVREVLIPKGDGKYRPLGIPTITDRIAQMAVVIRMNREIDKIFHENSYGYRPNKSAIQAVGITRKRCWRYKWVIDLDIKGFFDNIDHELLMKAVRKHIEEKWILIYIERWLKSPVQKSDGILQSREKGTPQGGVVSPILANLFLHYAFDMWIVRNYPNFRFIRYADDCIVHCTTLEEAKILKDLIAKRLRSCKLVLHPGKTKIVCCIPDRRKQENVENKFDFLGYTFRTRRVKVKNKQSFISFLPAVSERSKKKLRNRLKQLKIPRKVNYKLEEIANEMNPIIRGWMNYFKHYYKSEMKETLRYVNDLLLKWIRKRSKKYITRKRRAINLLKIIARQNPNMIEHWKLGIIKCAWAIRAV